MCIEAERLYIEYHQSARAYQDAWGDSPPPEYCQQMNAIRATIRDHQRACPECRLTAITPRPARARNDGAELIAPPPPVPTGRTLGARDLHHAEIIAAVECLNAARQGSTAAQIMKWTKRSQKPVYRVLRELVRAGKLRKQRGSYYVMAVAHE